MLVSGLPEADCRRLLGENAWLVAGPGWRPPDALLDRPLPEGAAVAWFFRAPSQALLLSDSPASAADALDQWTGHQRAALNLRRDPKVRLVVVNAAGTTEGVAHAWPAVATALPDHFPPEGLDPDLAGVIAWLVDRISPEAAEVHDLLHALAVNAPAQDGDASARARIATDREALGPLLATLLDRTRAEHDASQAARQATRRAGLLAIQLNQVRTELDLNFQRARALEDEANEATRLRQRLEQAERHDEQLSFKLQARLEEQLLAQEALRQQMESQYRAWQGSLEVLESERERRQAIETENRTLRMQLDILQAELRLATTPAEQPVPAGALKRRLDGLRRQVRRRIRAPGPPGPQADDDRLRAIEDLSRSGWLDRDWYSQRYADVGLLGIDPAQHYHDHGWSEGRDPGPGFSTRFYLETYPDVADSKIVPLLHFIRFGLREGRLPRAP